MALPSSFHESNDVLGKPHSMSHDQCESLSILRTETVGGIPCILSCWKVTKEELAEINRTCRVWVTVAGETHPPIAVDGVAPFSDQPKEG